MMKDGTPVTQPPDQAAPGSRGGASAEDVLRAELLSYMVGNCLSLGHVDSVAEVAFPGAPLAVRQARLMDIIGALLTDGLIVVGDIVGASDERVDPWGVPIEEALKRLHDLYIVQHDNWDVWGWTTWFELTESGQQVAPDLERQHNTDR